MGFWVSVLFFTLASSANAAIKIIGASGASNSNLATGITPTIYGGIAGTCASVDNTNTCNSCAAATTLATCNRTMVYPTLSLRISFTSDTVAGTPLLLKDTSRVNTDIGSVAKGSTAVATALWSNVCNYLGTAGTVCGDGSTSSFTADFRVGIDVNANGAFDSGDDNTTVRIILLTPDPAATGDLDQIDNCAANTLLTSPKPGLCDFLAYPGDSKAFIEDAEGGPGFPTLTTSVINKVRVYASPTGFITKPSDATPVDLAVSDATISDKTVSGLDNQVPYFFRVSSVDQANNEMYFTSDTAVTNVCGSLTPTAPFAGSCPYAAVPDKVLGLLEKDLNCFISTAAFGSLWHPKVQTFRQFRNHVLLPTRWGRKFVEGYYSWGPIGARWLDDHPSLRPVARAALWPLWWLSDLWLRHGGVSVMLAVAILMGLAVAAMALRPRRRHG